MSDFNAFDAPELPLFAAADLQDDLLTSTHDLERLQTLLDDSHRTLQAGFFGALGLLQGLPRNGPLDEAVAQLSCAVKAFQFQDMASQLIAHTRQRLHHCADQLARHAFASDDEDGEAVVEAAPLRANPVTQSAMNTGFVELF